MVPIKIQIKFEGKNRVKDSYEKKYNSQKNSEGEKQ